MHALLDELTSNDLGVTDVGLTDAQALPLKPS